MVDKHQIDIPQDICAGLSNDQFEKMIDVALFLEPLWGNALGSNWKDTIIRKKLREMYEKM
ncbi:MAG: 3-deoxy-alpha-D-manno-octulosonate 8-oxidase [Nonlabens sp.]|jgi:3-deoxy-alpha-D-manno-octulosonate 8-oxidase